MIPTPIVYPEMVVHSFLRYQISAAPLTHSTALRSMVGIQPGLEASMPRWAVTAALSRLRSIRSSADCLRDPNGHATHLNQSWK